MSTLLHKLIKGQYLVLIGAWLTLLALACSLAPETSTTFVEATKPSLSITQIPAPTQTPSYFQEGETLVTNKLSVTVLEHVLEGCYTSTYGDKQCPPAGAAFLWVHLEKKHTGNSSDLPIYSCLFFTLIYRDAELQDSQSNDFYPDRESWSGGGCDELYADHSSNGWVSFEVPSGIVLSDAMLRIKSYQGPEFEQLWKLEN